MKHLSVKKPGQRRKLKGNATGLNMIGIGKISSAQSSPPVQGRPVLTDYLLQHTGIQHILPSPLVLQGRVFHHAFIPTVVAHQQRNDGLAGPQTEVPTMINHVPAESAVVLSSGDEGICDGAGTPSPNRQDCNTPSPGSTMVAILSSPSPSNGSMEALDDDDILPVPNYFTSLKAKARQPRKSRMKDQFGKSPVKVVPPRSKRPTKRQQPKRDDPSSPPLKKLPEYVVQAVRLIRVGTERREVNMPVIFTTDYIQVDIEVHVATSTLISCHWCLNRKLPSLFLRTTPAECQRLRFLLNMSRLCTQEASWYDSKGTNLDERYIILIFEDELPELDQVELKRIFETIARENHIIDFTGALTFEEANSIIMNSSKKTVSDPDIFQNQFLDLVLPSTESATPVFEKAYLKTTPGSPVSAKEASEVPYGPESPQKSPEATACQPPQPSSPQPLSPTHSTDNDDSAVDLSATFNEPVRRLIVYPPPPARQGISVTNEDLLRLDEGEFLNDVIIDFYLRYLVMSKLKEEDAKRCYMFSSFFYKRLTQTDQENISGEKKRRHSRVKTWTRHVDLFQKDFIFVPINQSAHWFLAVICFPGLEGSQLEPESPHQPPPSPPPPSPQDLGPDPTPSLNRHYPVDDPSTEPPLPLPRDPDPSLDHLQQTGENPSLSGLFTPPPQCPEEPVSPLWEGSEDYMDQAFVLDFTVSPNPMSLFFSAMEDDPDVDLPDEGSGAMSTSDEAGDLLSSIIELCVTASTSPGDQTDGQQPHGDVCHKDSEEARDVDMFSLDQDAERDECSGKEQQDEQKEIAEVLSKPAVCKCPCILLMDSLGGHGSSDIVETLQEYLEVEWEQRKGTRREFSHMEGSVPKVPQQDNLSDCGVYLLQYAESFFQDPLKSFQPPIDLKEWFPLKQVKSKREGIRKLILTLEQQQETRT